MMTLGDLMSESARWGLRGDPYLWEAMRERLSAVPLSATETEARAAFLDAWAEEVGERLETTDEEFFRIKRFEHGGMSSGGVHVETWRDRLIPLLVSRWEGAREAND